MPTQVGICNLALSRLGVQQDISNINDATSTARACKKVYDQCREHILRERPWPFAQRYVTLALVSEAPNIDWSFAYRYPANFLRVNRIMPTNTTVALPSIYADLEYVPNYKQTVPWQEGSDTQGKLIYTDQELAQAVGTYDCDDESQYDPLFVDCLAYKLAYELAMSLTKDNGVRNDMLANYEVSVQRAMATALNEGFPKEPSESTFITARY